MSAGSVGKERSNCRGSGKGLRSDVPAEAEDESGGLELVEPVP